MALNLGHKVGPLPMGAWVAVVAGGLGVGYVAKRKQAGTAAPLVSATTPLLPAAPSTTSFLAPALPGPSDAPPIDTNQAWETACTRRLIARGADPYRTQQAIRRYISGLDPLDGDQAQLIQVALTQCGPSPVPPAYVGPPSVATPVPVAVPARFAYPKYASPVFPANTPIWPTLRPDVPRPSGAGWEPVWHNFVTNETNTSGGPGWVHISWRQPVNVGG